MAARLRPGGTVLNSSRIPCLSIRCPYRLDIDGPAITRLKWPMDTSRLDHLKTFYELIGLLEARIGGARALAECSGTRDWPRRGVYFFREEGESRTDTGTGPRIVRVGTHALKAGSGTTLRSRLSQHRGQLRSGGGNHRGSIFRLIVGTALIARDGYHCPTWDDRKSSAPAAIRAGEQALERAVSEIIGAMPFLWVGIDDEPGADSARGIIERNAIGLLSNYGKEPIDPPSSRWLGHYCNRSRVRASGLWNANHVDEAYDPAFLDRLEMLVAERGMEK